jgi:glycosyltransferase involved in cell wall biosynthesis
VLLGYGALQAMLADQVTQSPYVGRVHLLAAVAPTELLDWTCSADVMLMAIQPTTLNHRFTTPNKLWEAMAAGVPVVASDLPGMAAIVRETGCGVLCDPTSPADVARAIRSILDLPADARAELRARGLAAAHDRYNWAAQASTLLSVYAGLSGTPAILPPSRSIVEGS